MFLPNDRFSSHRINFQGVRDNSVGSLSNKDEQGDGWVEKYSSNAPMPRSFDETTAQFLPTTSLP
jgi:hypothetical protein